MLSQAEGMFNQPQSNEKGWANSFKEKIWIERNKRHKGSLFKAIAPRALFVR